MKARKTVWEMVLLLVLLFAWVTVALAGQGRNTLSQGLVAYWKFDEAEGAITFDETGNNNDGTIYGASWVAGKIREALKFDGSTAFVVIPNSRTLNVTDAITVTLWVKTASDFSTARRLIAKKSSYLFEGVANSLFFELFIDGKYRAVKSHWPRSSTEAWVHIAGMYDSSSKVIKLYLNGVEVARKSLSALSSYIINVSGSKVEIGMLDKKGFFSGLIDEVRIYNRALTADEIKELFQQSQRE